MDFVAYVIELMSPRPRAPAPDRTIRSLPKESDLVVRPREIVYPPELPLERIQMSKGVDEIE